MYVLLTKLSSSLLSLKVWKLLTVTLCPWMQSICTKQYASCKSYIFSTLELGSRTQAIIWPSSASALASSKAALEVKDLPVKAPSFFLCLCTDCLESLSNLLCNPHNLGHHVPLRLLRLVNPYPYVPRRICFSSLPHPDAQPHLPSSLRGEAQRLGAPWAPSLPRPLLTKSLSLSLSLSEPSTFSLQNCASDFVFCSTICASGSVFSTLVPFPSPWLGESSRSNNFLCSTLNLMFFDGGHQPSSSFPWTS